MINLMNNGYSILKALHLFAAFAWMAGMFYLPRLYAYHAEVGPDSPEAQMLKRMERGLLRIIMNPAMIVTLAIGLWLAFGAHGVDFRAEKWIHVKLGLVVVLMGLHGFLAKWRRDFDLGRNRHSPRFYRIVNEVPTLALLGIVLLVVIKPF